MKQRKVNRLLRMRARLIARHDEINRICAFKRSLSEGQTRQLIRLKGMIASVEEQLRQAGIELP